MWSKNKGKTDMRHLSGKTSLSLIAADAQLSGELRFQGAVQIDGYFNGRLIAEQGLVTVSLEGRIDGEIRASHVEINGQVSGDIYASERLELGSQAKVVGNLHYALMEMAEGAKIEGRLQQIQDSGKLLELPDPQTESDE